MANKSDTKNFEQDVLKASKPVVVDFWAEWCGPCRVLGPILDDVSTELSGVAEVIKINVDDNPELAQKYGIRGIPTMIFFKNGQIEKTLVGVQAKEQIKDILKELADK